MYKEKILDLITGAETWRDYTTEEIEAAEAAEAQSIIEQAEREAEATAKAAARQAVLDKLGLTAEEMAALLP